MIPFHVRVLRKAQNDINTILTYLGQNSIQSADRFLDDLEQSKSRLSRFPYSGASPRDIFLKLKGFRILIMNDYLLFYKVQKRIVMIYRIIHGRRKYAYLF